MQAHGTDIVDGEVYSKQATATYNQGNAMENIPASFQEFITTSQLPVLVDFWAEWCGPCKMMGPVLHELAREWKGRINIIKVNTEKKQELSVKYGISAIPTMILFKNGSEVHRLQGAMPLQTLKNELSLFV